ncbi:MAG: bifunctional hydroxymethylpyrimidine kinase/phosphomethylpyrimidine kinase [Bacteroidota bacterium]|nr:bifunctional hydroxymethylpyrimidine kinase/phosphomethylpyrimidine kinase [Bacteroidota bacterium]
MSKRYARALTIAGSDSGGGAGIQADLKTFSALGCYGLSVITALTAQNTQRVRAVYPVSADFIGAQLDAVLEDIGADAIKIGMLHTEAVIQTVAERLSRYGAAPVVLDPVMVAKSGDRLLEQAAIEALRERLLPLATVITPNLPEAEVLLGQAIRSRDEMPDAARKLLELGPEAVLLKGGHLGGSTSPDLLLWRSAPEPVWLEAERIQTRNTHGTGCTLSSAIAAHLARGYELLEAVRLAKAFLSEALRYGAVYELGAGRGPVHHFYRYWE